MLDGGRLVRGDNYHSSNGCQDLFRILPQDQIEQRGLPFAREGVLQV